MSPHDKQIVFKRVMFVLFFMVLFYYQSLGFYVWFSVENGRGQDRLQYNITERFFEQTTFQRDPGTHQMFNMRLQNTAFSDAKKCNFCLPLDRSHKRKSSGGHFCRTSPAKLKISNHRKLFLGVSNSFRSLHVRFWRPLVIRHLGRRWVDSKMSIS